MIEMEEFDGEFPIKNFTEILDQAMQNASSRDIYDPVNFSRRSFNKGKKDRIKRAAIEDVARQMAAVCHRSNYRAPGTCVADNIDFEVEKLISGKINGIAIVDCFDTLFGFALFYAEEDNVRIDLICTKEYQEEYEGELSLFRRLMAKVFHISASVECGVVLDAAGARLTTTYSKPAYGGFRMSEDPEMIANAADKCTPMYVLADDVEDHLELIELIEDEV